MSLISFLILKNLIREKKSSKQNNLMKIIAKKTAKSILRDSNIEAETQGVHKNGKNA